MMAHVEMKAMEKLPIEKLSYDLKLELLENMDPKDVVELVKVNQEFRSIVVKEPWRIFGTHVDYIGIWDGCTINFEILKYKSEISMGKDGLAIKLSRSPYHMELKSYSTLIPKIRSCQELALSLSLFLEDEGQEAAQLFVELLKNLDSVSKLSIFITYDPEDAKIEKYLTSLTLNHIKKATLTIRKASIDERRLEFLSNFVVTNLNHCKSVEVYYEWADFSFWYETFSRISTEMMLITLLDFEELIHLSVTQGIPGSNPEPTILLRGQVDLGYGNDSIIGFLSRTPGIHRIADKDRGEIREILKKLLLDGLIPEHYISDVDRPEFLQEGDYFTRSIDAKRKCIYATVPDKALFFAKYITI